MIDDAVTVKVAKGMSGRKIAYRNLAFPYYPLCVVFIRIVLFLRFWPNVDDLDRTPRMFCSRMWRDSAKLKRATLLIPISTSVYT